MDFFGVDLDIIILTLSLIAGDVISGIYKSFETKSFTSSKMREGLFHKGGSIMLLILAMGLTIASNRIEDVPEMLEFAGNGLYVGVNAYIIIMEVASILENILSINPELNRYQIFKLFGRYEEEDNENKGEDNNG